MSIHDDEVAALQGKLGRRDTGVREAFSRFDALIYALLGPISRAPILREGEWYGCSYKRGRDLILRIDPKEHFLRIQVGQRAYAHAPASLKGDYAQDDWIVVRPDDLETGLDCVADVLRAYRR